MTEIIKTSGLIEQHIHGAFGVDFCVATSEEIIELSKKLFKLGITGFFPTLVTDSVENLKRQIKEIKVAQELQPNNTAKVIGIHLEGPFINPDKKGIHDEKLIQKPSIETFQQIEDEIIKIVTIAPELDFDFELCDYLQSKGIKVSAGHTLTTDLSKVHQVTHLFNAMGTIDHKKSTTATVALTNDRIYTEVIADSIHINDEVLKLIFKTKPTEKTILISDALPIAKSNLKEMVFCNKTIYLNENKATSESGTIAGSAMLLPDIIKNLVNKNLTTFEQAIQMTSINLHNYHKIPMTTEIKWDSELNVIQ